MFFTAPQNDVISVSSLNRMARDLLESGLPPMWIGGEISNLTLAASGHAYFSLKDGGAQVRCVMFRGKVSQLPFRPAEGMQVELKGTVTLYEARGDFQINVDQMRSAGLGRLYEAFEKLKAKLQAEGLFNPANKRPLPAHPAAIGIVTSPAAAALRDVVSTLRRRMPGIPVILYPAQVQGEGSAQQVADAVRRAGERREVDVLIVCRGGGSIEDLWSFNEEIVARAVAASPIPTVSGVGHETDFTICDFVADKRAPTPTAAAELVSPSREHLNAQLETAKRGLERALGRLLTDKSQQLDYLARRLAHPGEKLQRQREALQRQQERLQHRLSGLFEQRRWALQLADSKLQRRRPDLAQTAQTLDRLQTRLQRARQDLLNRQTQKLDTLAATLLALNPEAVLARGYAIVQKQDGTAVKSPAELRDRERVSLLLAEGSTEAVIDHPQGAQPSLF
ncbi:exodeoxyribonuclease VII large subunit [Chromobacterium alkanivorans]|uniref:exodeoxyribonuclease VII large subunit n=1 Tax=Chromobacterium alkanivorans TaxID=1071719 RepID=UPI0021695377|nr:exodeoxyribonuclease VII large subunit [Chromobacterium alkanivorans]MCS3804975.1 exodeoxyribonuclease VII large subunit [Chromobacterium alkanivorans]MCS3819462.1 exodeoxyribonuclease VII large subunit [Chromobacterium alkanivorans]MCS3873974.1 exodeoxyribonuclease VII large subunit [Chromobacterium alkanivorans]